MHHIVLLYAFFLFSNEKRVLGEQAVANPSQIEAQVRKAMKQRLENHEKRNQERSCQFLYILNMEGEKNLKVTSLVVFFLEN